MMTISHKRRWPVKKRRRRLCGEMPYTSQGTLLSQGELAFYHALVRSIEGRCAVSLKTRLADILRCPAELWNTRHGRRLSQKHVDFVLHCAGTGRIFGVIELDDASHDRPERRRRDQFLRRALRKAGVPLLQVRAAAHYFPDELKYRLARLIRPQQRQVSRRREDHRESKGQNSLCDMDRRPPHNSG